MKTTQELERRREAILEQIRAIRSLKRGSITEQFLEVPQKGKKQPARRGPYYVFSRHQGNKTHSRRLRTPEELEQARQDIEAHQRFVALCREFEEVTEQLGEREQEVSPETLKKKRTRSRRSGSRWKSKRK